MELKKRLSLFIISLLTALVLLRVFLSILPSTNLNFLGYNVHHLFIGAFLMVILLLLFIVDMVNKITIVLAGISSALVLDEIIYLIVTDGSDISYLTPVSLLGMIILTGTVLILTIILYSFNKQKSIK